MIGTLRRLWGRVLREHSSPARLAAASALGIFIGCSPFYGLHFWIGVSLAVALRLNKLAVFFGTQTVIPPAVPLVILCDVQTGSFLRRGTFRALSVGELTAADAPRAVGALLADWLVGWLLVGGTAAAVTFTVVLLLLRLRRSRGLA